MNIDCVGGGPGGLYFAIQAKKKCPAARIRVFERYQPDRFAGWGIVLDEEIRGKLLHGDSDTARAVNQALHKWDTIRIRYGGRQIISRGYRFACISRKRLIDILTERAREVGVELHYARDITSAEESDADLIVASDGVGSLFRQSHADALSPTVKHGSNRYIWCGTPRLFRDFSFVMHKAGAGWLGAQAYQYSGDCSTFIVECDQSSYEELRLGARPAHEAMSLLQRLFDDVLRGAPLLTGQHGDVLEWNQFLHVSCQRWYDGKLVLLGDAAHTSHYSVGSGTKLALEDGMTLAECLFESDGAMTDRLDAYQKKRQLRVQAVQRRADASSLWFERLSDCTDLTAEQFACALLTRTQFNGRPPDPGVLDKMLQLAHRSKERTATDTRFGHLLGPLNFTVEECET